MELTFAEIIQKLAAVEKFSPVICKVISVSGNEAELQVLSGGENIKDARLKVNTSSSKGLKIEPVIGSEVIAMYANNGNIAFIVGYSDIINVEYNITGKIKIANDAQNLKDILHDFLQAIINIKVATPAGPSTGVINSLDFVVLNQRLNLLLS